MSEIWFSALHSLSQPPPRVKQVLQKSVGSGGSAAAPGRVVLVNELAELRVGLQRVAGPAEQQDRRRADPLARMQPEVRSLQARRDVQAAVRAAIQPCVPLAGPAHGHNVRGRGGFDLEEGEIAIARSPAATAHLLACPLWPWKPAWARNRSGPPERRWSGAADSTIPPASGSSRTQIERLHVGQDRRIGLAGIANQSTHSTAG